MCKKPMKFLFIAAAILLAGLLALLAMGYVFQTGENEFHIIGPAEVSPYDSEAETSTPECQYEEGKIDGSRIYTGDEVKENAAMAKACMEAKIKYIKSKNAEEK